MVLKRIGVVAAAVLVAGCAAGGGAEAGPCPEPGRVVRAEPVRVGVVVPRSGSEYLQRYGDLVLEGVELAALARSEAEGARPVVLDVVDDGGEIERAAAAVKELERRGAVAVIGPVLPGLADAAARARSDQRLVLVDPLGSAHSESPNVFVLNTPDVRGAEALARYAARQGWTRIGILYPRTAEYRRQAEAFSAALHAEGGRVVAEMPYEAGTTTFATHLRAIAAAAPQAIYVPAPEQDVHQIAPQITYYGLAGAGVKVLGGESWTAESVQARVATRYLEGVIASTPLPPSNAEVGWDDFVARYEAAYHRSLGHPYPALGYDAMRLVLAALDEGADSAAEVAEAVHRIRELRGATGVLSVEQGRVVRRPYLVRYEQGEIKPATRPDGAAPPAPEDGWRDR